MNVTQDIRTALGQYIQDRSGTYHYRPKVEPEGEKAIKQAVRDALSCDQGPRPAFFWVKGVPCPILPNDTEEVLYKRWYKWYTEYEDDQTSFLLNYEAFTCGE